jgi:rhodanese-related sulfurtransferase
VTETRRRVEHGEAVLVDIREPDEHAREYIAAARSLPLSQFKDGAASSETLVVFHCQSGNRTAVNSDLLSRSGAREMSVMEGGLNAWKAAGLPTVVDRRQPLPLQRQVMIAAGSIVIASLVLAWLVSPWFAGVALFMGCGLTFAGISGWCGLAKLLQHMPWNAGA